MKYCFALWVIGMMSCSQSTIETQYTPLRSTDQVPFLKSDEIKLSDPILTIDSIIFKHASHLVLEFGLENSNIFYKIDDGEFQRYVRPLTISESAIISFKTQKEGYQDSNVSQAQLVKTTNKLKGSKIAIAPLPHDSYPGRGASSLIDLARGKINFRANNAWSGFQSKTVEIDLKFNNVQTIKKVIVSILEDHGSWIFAPEKIRVIIDDHLIEEKIFDVPKGHTNSKLLFLSIPFKEISGQSIKVIIENFDSIPEWHPGRGTAPWLFIDEILVE